MEHTMKRIPLTKVTVDEIHQALIYSQRCFEEAQDIEDVGGLY